MIDPLPRLTEPAFHFICFLAVMIIVDSRQDRVDPIRTAMRAMPVRCGSVKARLAIRKDMVNPIPHNWATPARSFMCIPGDSRNPSLKQMDSMAMIPSGLPRANPAMMPMKMGSTSHDGVNPFKGMPMDKKANRGRARSADRGAMFLANRSALGSCSP